MQTTPGDQFELTTVGEDPAVVIADVPRVLGNIATIQWDEPTRRRGPPPASVLHPTTVVIYTASHIVFLDGRGRPIAVTEQDPKDPRMFDQRVAVLVEPRTGAVWFLGEIGDFVALKSPGGSDLPPDPTARAGETQLIVFMPNVIMPPELVRSLRARATSGGGKGGDANKWAQDSVDGARARRRRAAAKRAAAARAPASTGPQRPAPGAPELATGETVPADAAPQPPLRGEPQLRVVTDGKGKPWLRITLDRAVTTVELRESDTPTALDQRIDKAIAELQASRDPTQHEALVGGVTKTGFVTRPGETGKVGTGEEAEAQARSTPGATTPDEQLPGGHSVANAAAYPATITTPLVQPGDPPPITASGASNEFTMDLNYAALSYGFSDEVWNRLQPVQFYWELIDVTGLSVKEARARAGATAQAAGETKGVGSGQGAAISRELTAIGEDESADIEMMSEQHWPWEARAGYLAVIGISNTVRIIGSLIESFVSVITEPENERSIGFDHEGDFLIRCVATPLPSDEARADPDHHVIRASSVAVLPIRVENIGTRAARAVDEEARELAAAEARLREAEASHDPKRIAEARAHLEALRGASTKGAYDLFTGQIEALRKNVRVAEAVKANLLTGKPEKEWEEDELNLQIALVLRKTTVDEYLPAARAQLVAVAGKDDADLDWVRSQHDKLKPVGGHVDFRPRAVLASRETGQVVPLRLMLGRVSGPTERHARWLLVDFTSPAIRDYYEGESALPGVAGDTLAIRDCFRKLAESGNWGRGTLAIRLPAELSAALGQPVESELSMESRPGPGERALQRLRDLAKAAEFVGLFATGGAASALGFIGGVAGAIGSVESLIRRARTGHFWEIGTVFDVLGVVGGVAATAQVGTHIAGEIAEAERLAGRLPPWVSRVEKAQEALHIYGRIGAYQQRITIEYTLMETLNAIDEDPIPQSDGRRRARRALAFLEALRSGAVTVVQEAGGFGFEEPLGRTAPRQAGVETERAVGPSREEVVAKAQELARVRLRVAQETTREISSDERAGPGREDLAAVRTAEGTTRPAPREAAATTADVNAAEHALAVKMLAERLGELRLEPSTVKREPAQPGAYGARTRSAEEAVGTYDRAVAASGLREAGLFYNPNTGEFAVQVGTDVDVHAPAGDGWHALVHFHPNPENVIIRRLPSPADIMGALRAAARTGRHVEFVQSQRPDGSTGITRVEVTLNPRRIVVEMPAEPGEVARRFDVSTVDEYARAYGEETTHLDPASPLYQWVRADLDRYHAARRAGEAHGGEEGRTAAGTATERPGTPAAAPPQPAPHERLAAGRPDVAARIAEADVRHAETGAEGPPPSQRLDEAIRELERSGLGEPGRALIEQRFRPATGSDVLSATRFHEALGMLEQVSQLVRERPDLLTSEGLQRMHDSVQGLARDVFAAYEAERTLEGRPLRAADRRVLAEARDNVVRALADYESRATTDPIERLMSLLELRRVVVERAAETLRVYEGRFTSTTVPPGPVGPSGLVRGVQERQIEARGAGRIGEPLARDLPGVGLEKYALTPRDLAELPTIPPGLGRLLANLLRGYHRAHLIGPGFGGELFEGLMLAPEVVNLEAQNKGVEKFIRDLAAAGADVHVDAHATGRQLLVPLEGGGIEPVEILTRVEYTIKVDHPERGSAEHRVVIEVGDPPNGTVVVESTIPPDLEAGAVLRQFARGSPAQ